MFRLGVRRVVAANEERAGWVMYGFYGGPRVERASPRKHPSRWFSKKGTERGEGTRQQLCAEKISSNDPRSTPLEMDTWACSGRCNAP